MTVWPTQTSLRRTPDAGLPIRFIGTGLVGYLVLQAFVAWQAGELAAGGLQTREMLVTTHLFTLGWGTMVVVGAMYQLLPVILEVSLHSEPLGYASWWLYAPGVAIMVSGFWLPDTTVIAIGGTLVVAGMHFFLWTARRTMRAREARPSTSARYLRVSLTFLGLTLVWGFTLALNLRYRFLGGAAFDQLATHAALGLGGWFTLTAIGVSYRLIPMFSVSTGFSERPAAPLLWTLAVGFGGLALSASLGSPARNAFLWLTGLGLFGYLAHAAHIVSRRHRPRLELTLKFAIAAWTALGTVTAAVLLWNAGLLPGLIGRLGPDAFDPRRLAAALGYLGAMGWLSLLIVGMLYKILPFMVWYALYRERAGREKTPLLKDLWSERGGTIAFWLLVTGTPATAAGIAVGSPALAQAGAWVSLAGAGVFAGTMAQVLAHRPPWARPDGAGVPPAPAGR